MFYIFLSGAILGALARHLWPSYREPVAPPKRPTAAKGGAALPAGATRTRETETRGDGEPEWEFDLSECACSSATERPLNQL